jgi:opacity protein-like surface antigen
MKHALIAIALAAGLSAGAAAADWDAPGELLRVQAQKGGPGPGAERNERGRDMRQNRPDERRERMTQDERQSLHRDLDKANREIYGGRRPQK